MRASKKLLYGCILLSVQACNSAQEEEKQLPQDVVAITADLLRQESIMDSIITAEETEFAQQIMLRQQLMDVKLKEDDEKSRSDNDRDFNTLTTAEKVSEK